MKTETKFYVIQNHFVPAPNAGSAKRSARIFHPNTVFGENHNMKARLVTDPVEQLLAEAWYRQFAVVQSAKRKEADEKERLNNAAPDLLAALEAIMNQPVMRAFDNTPERKQARAAIAKARAQPSSS